MRFLVVLFLSYAAVLVAFEDELIHKVTYNGGSITEYQPGEHMKLDLYQDRLRILREDATLVDVVSAAVLKVSYGEDLQRVGSAVGIEKASRGVDALWTKRRAKRYFVGIAWNREGVVGGAAFQLNKDDYQDTVSDLERFTGKKAIDTEVTVLTK